MRIFLVLGLLLGALCAHAQLGVLRGTVSASDTKDLLVGVNVIAENGSGVTTDIDGTFEITLNPGTQTIIFRYIGFEPLEKTYQIKAGEATEVKVALDPSVSQLEMVVISAGRYEQRLEELTVSMEVIKPYLIENRNNTNISQVLDQTPGVILVDGEPQIRGGSGYSFGAGSRVQVLLDDIPMLSGDIGRPNWGYLPTENVEQIEVIKGASSVLYGSAALSGVINLRTAYPRDEPITKVSIFNGVYSAPRTSPDLYWRDPDYRHELGVYHPVQNVVSAPMQGGANFFHSRKVGQLDVTFGANLFSDMGFTGPETPDKFDENGRPLVWDSIEESGDTLFRRPAQMSENRARGNLNLRYRFKDIEGLSVGINSNAMYSLSSFALLWLDADTGLYRPRTRGITTTEQLNFNIDPYVEYIGKKGRNHKLKTRYFHLDNENTNNQSNYSRTYFAEYTVSQDFSHYGIEGLNITAGGMTTYTDAWSNLYVANERGDGENFAHNSALFMQIDKRLFDRLTLSGGVRYEWFRINNDFREAPIFRAGANYRVLDGTFVRASIGQGIRFPTIGERFIVTAVGGQNIFPNPDLQAERSYNAEFGVKQGFEVGGFRGFVDAAVFYQEFDNFIEFTFGTWGVPEPLGPGFNIQQLNEILGFRSVNTGPALVRGLDFSVMGQGKIGNIELNLLFGYTYVQPVALDPDKVYSVSGLETALGDNYPVVPEDPADQMGLQPVFAPITYRNTSSFGDGSLLKYRVEHMAKLDIEATYKGFSMGTSVRMNTPIRNIDRAFIVLDTDMFLPSGVTQWMEDNQNPIYVVDIRASVKVSKRSKVALIVNNLYNTEYAIRPLSIESPRLTMLQYSLEI